MTALTSDRNTLVAMGDTRHGPLAAGARVFAGALVMRDAAGFLVAGQTALNLVGLGRAEQAIDNSGGADGERELTYRPGLFLFANESGDPITQSDCGKPCFAVDDQTVASTDGGGTRSPAGIVESVATNGVWVRLDEALTRATT